MTGSMLSVRFNPQMTSVDKLSDGEVGLGTQFRAEVVMPGGRPASMVLERMQGRLTEWNDGRGFGFITPLAGGPKLFVHVSEFPTGVRRPLLNDLVTYETSLDERGRSAAVGVLHLTPVRSVVAPSDRVRRRTSPILIPILIVVLIAAAVLMCPSLMAGNQATQPPVAPQSSPADSEISAAFRNQLSGIQVVGQGTVTTVLSDDNNGDRHQRFILRLASGQTLLIAHNIDIAPRIPALAYGAPVSFSGVYEWNAEGGVVHWTHHDPDGRHPAGWLDHGGIRYQ